MKIEKAIEEFMAFLKAPSFDYKRDQPLDFLTATKLYFLVFFFEMLVFIPVSMIIGLEGIPHAMENLLQNNSIWKMVLLAVVLAPVAEELLFRLHLRYHPLMLLFVGLVGIVCSGMIFSYFSPSSSAAFQNLGSATIPPFLMALGFLALALLFYSSYLLFQKRTFKSVEYRFPFIFYLTALVFGLVHISNFGLDPDRWYLGPLLVLPQLILACYLGYIRVRNNLGYSIYIHALNNAIPMLLFSLGVQQ